jgi:tetratricopeptide (TPR) repeat protein
LNNIAEKHGGKGDELSHIYWLVGERFNTILHNYEAALYYYNKHFELQEKPRRLQGVFSQAFLYNTLGEYQKSMEAWETIIKVHAEDYDTVDGNDIDWFKREIEHLKTKITEV